ncbi:MAG: 2,3,4,5-tetrahydropyridine-2,6-dicarboxylate N-succinyltransferase [Pseudomonadota bacterium]
MTIAVANTQLTTENLETIIERSWNTPNENSAILRSAVDEVIAGLDSGRLRIAESKDGQWHVNTWLKQAVLLSFRLNDNQKIAATSPAYDKVPLKFSSWSESDFASSRIRAVPGSFVRQGAYVAPDVVLMPSFVNIGAYVGQGTLIDTWVTVGSCAQVGKHCHISGGVGIGGVLEPLQANPVIIEDNCFIGARSEVVEGVIVERGSVIGMGVFLGASTPIINRTTGEITYGRIPPYSVVIAGTKPAIKPLPDGSPSPSLACAVIVKQVDAGTRSKTAINDLLRP